MIPYMESKGGAFSSSDTKLHLANRHRLSRYNQSYQDPTLGFRTFRTSRQEKEDTP